MQTWMPHYPTRKRVIQAILQPTSSRRVSIRPIAHQVMGGVLWAVMEETRHIDDTQIRYLSCSLFFQHQDGWSFLTYTEDQFGNLYDCPLNYLDRVPEPINPTWRNNVKAFHHMLSQAA